MDVSVEALNLLKSHKKLTKKLEELQSKIEDEEGNLYPLLINLIAQMTPDEFVKVYRSIDDSDLKFRIFKYVSMIANGEENGEIK